MAGKQYIDFEHGTDTGERTDSDSIQPIIDGESVLGAVLNRPPENLRYRTELLRAFGDDTLYRLDSDRWIITGGTAAGVGAAAPVLTSWSSTTGIFVTTGDMVLQPLMGPNTDVNEVGTFPIVDGGLSATFTVTTTRRAYAHGNESRIIFEEAPTAELPGGNVAATLEGSPLHTLRVIVRDDGLTTVTQVYNAIVALGGGATVGMTIVLTGDAATKIDLDLIPAEYRIWQATKVADRELNHIPASSFAAFFVTSANRLADGDSIGIYFPYMVDPTGNSGGRRESTVTTTDPGSGSPPNTGVAYTQLFNSRVHPEYLPYAIPLCRRIGTSLIFVDGTMVEATATDPRAFGSGHIVAHTHHAGHKSADTFDIAAGSVQSVLQALQLFVNDKASLDAAETVTGAWTFDTSTVFQSMAMLAGVSERSVQLLWRYPNLPDASVTWTTHSTYLVRTQGIGGTPGGGAYAIYKVSGATLSYASSMLHITPAPAGPAATGYFSIACDNASIGDTLDSEFFVGCLSAAGTANTPVHWDVISGAARSGQYTVRDVDGVYTTYIEDTNRVYSARLATDIKLGAQNSTNVWSSTVETHYSNSRYRSTNRVLYGLHTLPNYVGGSVRANAGKWVQGQIKIAAGAAVVNGKLVVRDVDSTITVNASTLLDAYPAATVATSCTWFGVWLRIDGSICVGNLPAGMGDLPTIYPLDNSVGRILASDVQSGLGYGISDYTLIDVVWAYNGTATTPATYANLYYAGVEHVSSNWNLLGAAQIFNGATWDMVTPLVSASWTGAASAAYDQVPLKFNGAVKRSPGLPIALTNTALLRVHTALNSRNSATSSFALTLDNTVGIEPMPWGIQPAFDASVMLGTVLNNVYHRQLDNAGASSLLQTQIDVIEYPYASTLIDGSGGVVVRTFATAGGDASGSYQIGLLGFVWDRLAAYPQCLDPVLRY
jgi:hypothetical protein